MPFHRNNSLQASTDRISRVLCVSVDTSQYPDIATYVGKNVRGGGDTLNFTGYDERKRL